MNRVPTVRNLYPVVHFPCLLTRRLQGRRISKWYSTWNADGCLVLCRTTQSRRAKKEVHFIKQNELTWIQ
eukprot:scaffold436031_cov18-Prasinocladus_malaysianus.AAC.1